jgi:hypothetical protein
MTESAQVGVVTRVAIAVVCVAGAGFGGAVLLAGVPLLWERWQHSGDAKTAAMLVMAALAVVIGAVAGSAHGIREVRDAKMRGDTVTPGVRPALWALFGLAASAGISMALIFGASGEFSLLLDESRKRAGVSVVFALVGVLVALSFGRTDDPPLAKSTASSGAFWDVFFTVASGALGLLGLVTFIQSGRWIGLVSGVCFGGVALFMWWSRRRNRSRQRRTH